MANVRIDASGVPKAPVIEQTTPASHRTGVTAVDGADPASSAGVSTDGYQVIDFDLDVTLGGTNPAVEVAPTSATYGATGKYRLRAEARGATVYLKVIALTGTAPTLSLNVWSARS
jgi:hypothetical protein